MSAFVLDDYSARHTIRVALLSIFIVPTLYLVGYTNNEIAAYAVSGVFPVAFNIIYSLYSKSLKNNYKRLIFVIVAHELVSWLMLKYKTGLFELGYNPTGAYEALNMSFELTTIYAGLYLRGGVINGKAKQIRNLESFLFPAEISICADGVKDSRSIDEVQKAGRVAIILTNVLILGFNVMQFSGIMLVIYCLTDVFVETLIIYVSFIVHGFVIQRRYHCKTLTGCTLLTLILFYVAAKLYSLSIGFDYLQTLPVIIGGLVVYMMYRISLLEGNKYEQVDDGDIPWLGDDEPTPRSSQSGAETDLENASQRNN